MKSVPMIPFAPARFSIVTGWPRSSCTFGSTIRAVTSAPPGGKGTITRMGLAGNAWAGLGAGTQAPAAPAATMHNSRSMRCFAVFMKWISSALRLDAELLDHRAPQLDLPADALGHLLRRDDRPLHG